MENSSPAEFDPELAELIRVKVNRLIGHFGWTHSDREDLQQQLYMLTFPAMRRHDPKRAKRTTHADHNVTSKIATIIEGRQAKKRDWRKQRPLEDADQESFSDAGKACEDLDLAIDLRDTLARLPADLQKWAVWFMELSKSEIVDQKGQSRAKVRQMWCRLCEHFRELGLGPDSPD